MADLFFERAFETPIGAADVVAMGMEKGCFAVHRAEWQESMLASDGRRLLCRFRGPDAESVRIALRSVNAAGRFWAGTIHEAPDVTSDDLRDANVLVERAFDPPMTFDEVRALAAAGAGCLDAHRVRWLRTFFSNDRRRMICLYQAPDAESVRLAQRRAGMPHEDVWAFTTVRPGDAIG